MSVPDAPKVSLVPEGDTIYRAARRLHAALVGRALVRFQGPPLTASRVGRVVVDVRSRGKNLIVAFDDGLLLCTHLLMSGSWHVQRLGEPWRKPAARATVVMENDAWAAVGFDLPIARFARSEAHVPRLARLGVDLLSEAPIDVALPRLRALGDVPIGVALLRQQAVAGIGNVYKSEVLFLERVDPFGPLSAFDDGALRRVLERARTSMRQNLGGGRRTTRRGEGGRHWVYDRSGAPCFMCGTPIRMRRQGDDGRSTYWCPECQPSVSRERGTARSPDERE
jgi:endonuclease-8